MSGTTQILSAANDMDRWRDEAGAFGPTDPCFSPRYHEMHARNGDGDAIAFTYREADQRFFHCFLKRAVPASIAGPVLAEDSWCDLQTVYGYGGPLSNSRDDEFLKRSWEQYRGWCEEAKVVAEFIRFQPWLENHRLVPADVRVRLDRQTVVVEIPDAPEQLWEQYQHSQRKNVRKAEEAGLRCLAVGPEVFPTFVDQYLDTMRRNEAGAYYFYSESYFDGLRQLLETDAQLFAAYAGNDVAGLAVMCLAHPNMQYHLSGVSEQHRHLRAHNLILHTAALWGQERGYRRLQLGGGRTSREDDDLLRFKGTLSRRRMAYYTGNWVHNAAVYDRLCGEWMRQSAVDVIPEYFLLYRKPIERPESVLKAG